MGALGDELTRLKRGRGVMAVDLPDRLGPTLAGMAAAESGGNAEDVRKRLVGLLADLADGLPEDLRVAFDAALAIREDVRFRFLDQRMEWLADWLQRDVRTARRRAEEAIRLVGATVGPTARGVGDYEGWYLARLAARLLLDQAEPVVIEDRRLVAARDDLTEISIATGIPVPRGTRSEKQTAELKVLYGGSLIGTSWPTATYFRYAIRLPKPLRCGQAHELGISITTPASQPLNPRYAIQPLRRCDEFDLRIRLGAGQARSVWRIAGLPRGMVDDFADPDALVQPDATGDIHMRYQQLQTGLVYGARWSTAALPLTLRVHGTLLPGNAVGDTAFGQVRCQDSRLPARGQGLSKWSYEAVQAILNYRPGRDRTTLKSGGVDAG